MDAEKEGSGAGEPRQVEQDELTDEDVLIVDDLGNEIDDTEDRLGPGTEAWSALPDPPPPTRLAWLLHLFAQSLQRMSDRASRDGSAWPAASERVPDEEWARLAEAVFGPQSRWACGEATRISVSAAGRSVIVITGRG